MKVYVISLRSAATRRANLEPQLASLGIEYSLFDAIDGRSGFDYFQRYDEEEFLINTGRRATPYEVACFASHRCLWKKAVSMDEPIIVLEDDAEIEDDFPAALSETKRLIHQYGFIRLQNDFSRRYKKRVPVRRVGPFMLNYYATYPYGAMGYVISPGAAAALVNASETLTAPVDAFIKLFWEHGQPLYGLYPFPVLWGDLAHETMIGSRDRQPMNLKTRLTRRLKKAGRWIERRKFNLAHQPSRYAGWSDARGVVQD